MKQLRGIELKRFLKKDKQNRRRDLIVIAENIQYAINVANMFRTLDAVRCEKLILTGISHKPPFGNDLRKASREKEKSLSWEYMETAGKAIQKAKKEGYEIIALEVTDQSKDFKTRNYPDKICIVVGNETYGVTKTTLEKVDSSVYLPMLGKGASLNVSVSLAILSYHITFA